MRETVAVTVAPTHASRLVIEQILAEMRTELDDVARSLTDAIHAHLDELDDDLYVGTLHSVRSNLGLMMTMLGDGTDPSLAVPPPEALAYAKEYVRRGLSFELLQRAYRTAQAAVTRMWLERLRATTSDPDNFAQSVGFFNDWLFTWIDALERQLTEAYMRERERWVRGSAAARAEQVRAILDGGPVDVADATKRLTYELRREHLAYVVWRDGSAGEADGHGVFAEMERLAMTVADAVGAHSHLSIPVGGHLACWAGVHGAAAADGLDGRLGLDPGQSLRIAVGLPGHGIEGFRRSHREAVLARRAAEVLGHGRDACVSFAGSGLDVLLTQDLDETRRFVDRELGRLTEDTDSARRLVATLRAFLAEGSSFVRAARRLGVHENTVAYRVRRAEELLGYRVAERRLELQVALRLISLAPVQASRER